jgi:hypothetical protein
MNTFLVLLALSFSANLPDTYTLSAWLDPSYLQGDFNGDGHTDHAVLVEEKSTGMRGILITHVGTGQQYVVGAGRAIGNGGADFHWMDEWQVYPRGVVGQGADLDQEPPVLSGDALLVIKTGAASALVYWTGTAYEWYQQGD